MLFKSLSKYTEIKLKMCCELVEIKLNKHVYCIEELF